MDSTETRPRVIRPQVPLRDTIHDGLHSAEQVLFQHCMIVQGRLERIGKVVNALEESLTTPQAQQELQRKSINVRFDYYSAFTRIMMSLVGYMERIHDIAADQAKFNAIRDKMEELSRTSPQDGDNAIQIVEGKQQITYLLDLLKEEMTVRARR